VELGRLADGFKALKKAVALKPDHVQSHFRLGLFYSLSGFPQEAIKEFQLVLRYGTTEPEVAEARKRLGDVLADADRREKALAYLVVANALDARREPEKALEAIREARKRNPGNRGVELRLTEVLMELGRSEEAREVILPIVKDHPDDSQFQLYLGKVEGKLGHLDEALSALQTASAASPDNVDIQLTLASALEQAKRGDEAVQTLRGLLARKPDEVQVVLALARLLRRLSRPAEAAALYDWYLSSHAETAEILVERGLLAAILGSARVGAEVQQPTALAGIVTGEETLAGQPKYATSAEWFERAIAVAGPNDQRFADFARDQLERSRRLHMNLTQTVIDYNTNANNSATQPLTGVSSRMVFNAQYILYRGAHLALPVAVTTDHTLYYTFQTYVNQNTLTLSARAQVPHLQLNPDLTLTRVRTQRGKTSDSYVAGAFASLDVPYPREVNADYRRTEFTSFTNPTNNYLQERLDTRLGHNLTVGAGFQVNGELRYTRRVLNAVAAIYDTDRTDRQVIAGARRSFSGQRTAAASVFLTDSTEIRTTNVLPSAPTKILPIDSRQSGATGSFSFPIYPHVTGTLTGTYSVTDFTRGFLQDFSDPTTGNLIRVETAQRQSSVSYLFRLLYRPDAQTNWTFDLRHVEARSSVDVPVDVQDILTDQVNLSNINGRNTATVTMNYAF
jgi:tetratricopeptide (TPR) repeat protein